MASLSGGRHDSKRGVEEVVATIFGVPLGLGTRAQLEQEMSAALAPAHAEAVEGGLLGAGLGGLGLGIQVYGRRKLRNDDIVEAMRQLPWSHGGGPAGPAGAGQGGSGQSQHCSK